MWFRIIYLRVNCQLNKYRTWIQKRGLNINAFKQILFKFSIGSNISERREKKIINLINDGKNYYAQHRLYFQRNSVHQEYHV